MKCAEREKRRRRKKVEIALFTVSDVSTGYESKKKKRGWSDNEKEKRSGKAGPGQRLKGSGGSVTKIIKKKK